MATPDTYGFKSPVYAAGNAILNQIFKCLFPDEMYVAGQFLLTEVLYALVANSMYVSNGVPIPCQRWENNAA